MIPAGTYAGQDQDIITTSLPVVAYGTTQMDDDTAYTLTKTFWDSKEALSSNAAWWQAVSTDMLANISTEIHPGAVKFYEEQGIELSDHHR